MSTPQSRAILIIEGKAKDVGELVELALALGVLSSVEVTRPATLARTSDFAKGDHVRVKASSSSYGVKRGWTGRISEQVRVGTYTVRWDEDNTESQVAQSLLEATS